MRRLLSLLVVLLAGCHASSQTSVTLLAAYPHQQDAFTQGLVFDSGRLFESTGLYGESSLREVDLETGEVLRRIDLPEEYFGEGIALVDGKLIMLTWREGTALVFDVETFEQSGSFSYSGEGWGLCFNGEQLVMSDGSSTLQFRDPRTFELLDTQQVTYQGAPLRNLNDLACADGLIYANVWLTRYIVRIKPDGEVDAVFDMSGLLSEAEWATLDPSAEVLNGLAWNEASGTLLVTGKRWPRLFELRIE